MKKTILVGSALAVLGAGTAFFIIKSSDSPNTPDNLNKTSTR